MARPRKAGFFIEADALHHWRFEVAGGAGTGVWAFAGAWCDEHLTDGHIPLSVAVRLLPGARAAIPRVTKSGLWTECAEHAECFVLHAYAEDGRGRSRQKTRAQIEAEREAQRARDERKRVSIPATFPDSSRREPPGNAPGTAREPVPLDKPSSNEVPPLSPPQGEPVPRAARPAKIARPLPADWSPTEAHRAFGAEHGLDVGAEARKFRDHAAMTGRLGKDWDAGFRMWLAKAEEFRAQRPTPVAERVPTPVSKMRRFSADD